MTLDFTIDKYTDLCEAIAFSGYAPLTVREYLETRDLPSKVIVVRHDVDIRPRNEPTTALIENDFGISATYYFRYKSGVFRPDIMRKIAAMGHEIGYHYETLDKAKGDTEKALEMFKQELAAFRDVADVRTISMHGNPLTRWDNRDLWRKYNVADYGILGEAYLAFQDIIYLTDTGRTWGPEHTVKDFMPHDAKRETERNVTSRVSSTDDVIRLVESGDHPRMYINTHAGRWGVGMLDWVVSFLQDTAANVVKRGLAMKARAGAK